MHYRAAARLGVGALCGFRKGGILGFFELCSSALMTSGYPSWGSVFSLPGLFDGVPAVCLFSSGCFLYLIDFGLVLGARDL